MREVCEQCHQKTVTTLIERFKLGALEAEKFRQDVDLFLSTSDGLDNPEVAMMIQRLAKANLNKLDLYKEEKSKANRLVYSKYHYWKKRVKEHKSPFYLAAKLAVAGNVIDYGARTVPDDIPTAIEDLVEKSFKLDDTALLYEKIKRAKNVLYLGDNAGEIVFDKLLIQYIGHENLTYVVRGEPVLNDATLEDAKQIGMMDVCRVIHNGSDAPSTLLNQCSEEFLQAYKAADLIIAKGMGNFEGLLNESDERIFFMLMAKCDPIASLLGVNKGDMLVRQFLT